MATEITSKILVSAWPRQQLNRHGYILTNWVAFLFASVLVYNANRVFLPATILLYLPRSLQTTWSSCWLQFVGVGCSQLQDSQISQEQDCEEHHVAHLSAVLVFGWTELAGLRLPLSTVLQNRTLPCANVQFALPFYTPVRHKLTMHIHGLSGNHSQVARLSMTLVTCLDSTLVSSLKFTTCKLRSISMKLPL